MDRPIFDEKVRKKTKSILTIIFKIDLFFDPFHNNVIFFKKEMKKVF